MEQISIRIETACREVRAKCESINGLSLGGGGSNFSKLAKEKLPNWISQASKKHNIKERHLAMVLKISTLDKK